MTLDLGDRSVFVGDNDVRVISWAVKTRAELIDLNYYKPWIRDAHFSCSSCNLNEVESVFHFVSICPILIYIRTNWFGNAVLSQWEFESYLNGGIWRALGNYFREAWKFNFLYWMVLIKLFKFLKFYFYILFYTFTLC